MSVSIEKLITFQDYSVKYDVNSKGIKPSAYYDTLKWTFDNYDKLKLVDRTKDELLKQLESYTDLRTLSQELNDSLSKEDAIKIMQLNDSIRDILGLDHIDYSKKPELSNENTNEKNYDTEVVSDAIEGKGKSKGGLSDAA